MLFSSKYTTLFTRCVIIFCILLAGCHNSSQNADSKNISNSTITNLSIYSASVESLTLPLKDTCYDTLTIQRLKLPDSLSEFKKYGQLVGKVKETKKYTAILYAIPADVQLPVLYVFDKKGKVISSLKLFIGNCCGENEDCSGVSTVQITKDLHIILKDSTQTFERDKKKYNKTSLKLLKKQEEFQIDSTGNIILTSSGSVFAYRLT